MSVGACHSYTIISSTVKTPDKLIEVQSLYINPKTHQIDYDQDAIQFEKDLNKIKKRLTPLLIGNANTAKIQVVQSQTHYVPAWHDQSQKIPQYKTIYISYNSFFKQQKSTSCAVC